MGETTTQSLHPEPVDGATSVPELLHHLGTHMHAIGSRFAASEQLHPTDVQALSILAMHGGQLTTGSLARELELSTGATTRLVDRLEKVGHVARHADAADRRRRLVAITPDAAATAGAFFGRLGSLVDEVLDAHPVQEQQVIRRFLIELVRAMELRSPS